MFGLRQNIIILVGLLTIQAHQRIVVVESVSVVDVEQIAISTRFRSSDILVSNRSRQVTASLPNFTDMGQVPTVKVDYLNTNSRKWRQIAPQTSVYLIKTVVDDADLSNFLQSHRNSSRVMLIPIKYQQYATKSRHICLYSPDDLEEETITTFLLKCLREDGETVNTSTEETSNPSNSHGLLTISISIAILWAITAAKLIWAWRAQRGRTGV